MQHEEHSTPEVKRFGTNTNGIGILIVSVVAIFLAIFCWSFWKDGSKEIDHYQIKTTVIGPGNEYQSNEHEHGTEAGNMHEAPVVMDSVATDSLSEHSQATDSTGSHMSDSAAHE